MKLTDEEILKACDSTKWIAPEGLALDIGRAIEAAVLAQGDMSPASTHGKNVSMKQGFEDMKQEPVAWATTYMGFPNQFFKEDDAEEQAKAEIERLNREYPQDKHKRAARALYTHPAPVNTALLERAAQLACDAVAFNGGSVQMEAHVRAAIAAAEKEMK